jgi:hypothetical protein
MFFLFVSICPFLLTQKKRTKRKPLFAGWVPGLLFLLLSCTMEHPIKATKKETGFQPKTWVEAGFLLLLFFSLKRKVEKVFLWYFLFPGKRKYNTS